MILDSLRIREIDANEINYLKPVQRTTDFLKKTSVAQHLRSFWLFRCLSKLHIFEFTVPLPARPAGIRLDTNRHLYTNAPYVKKIAGSIHNDLWRAWLDAITKVSRGYW